MYRAWCPKPVFLNEFPSLDWLLVCLDEGSLPWTGHTNMRRHSLWRIVYWSSSVLQWIAGTALALFAAATKANPKNWPWAMTSLTWLQDTAWLLIPLLTISLGLIQLLRSATGPPWIWQHVHYLLDTFRQHVFAREQGTPLHYNRVTLFKYVRFRCALCRWP